MEPLLPGTVTRRLTFNREEGAFDTSFGLSCDDLPELMAKRHLYLAPREEEYFRTLRVVSRRRSYLLGRLCVKEALAGWLGQPDRTLWEVGRGVFQQPVLLGEGTRNLQAGISHSGTFGIAVIHPEGHPIGVDIEEISPDRREIVRTQMTSSELGLAAGLEGDLDVKLMLMWSAKEALSKVLRTGLMTPFTVYEMVDLRWESACLLGGFKNFAQYRAISFPIQGMAFALVAPKRSEPADSLSMLREAFDRLNFIARSR